MASVRETATPVVHGGLRTPGRLGRVEVRAASSAEHWEDVAQLSFAYQRETALELGKDQPDRPEEVWGPVGDEVVDPRSVFASYLVAYEADHAVGGVALVAHDALSVALKRCYVRPQHRRRGVARSLVATAEGQAAQRGVGRILLDVLASRRDAITAWRRIGFVECEPWGDASMRYFEFALPCAGQSTWLGLERGTVALREHDPRWATVYQHHAEVVHRALADQGVDIEHVGSTSVEGLLAKPVVDLAARLTPGAHDAMVIASLEGRGYTFRGDKEESGGLLFVAEDQAGRRIAHLHVLRHHLPQWQRYLRLRDLLRADEATRSAYGALKRELARRFPADRGAYTAAKGSFIDELLGVA